MRQREFQKLVLEELRRLREAVERSNYVITPTTTPTHPPGCCQVCGLGPEVTYGYVCPRTDCPSRFTC